MLFIPVVVGIMTGTAYFMGRKKKGVMTPERLKVYEAALSGSLKDPASLDALADSFDKEGLSEQAKLLRQRATLRRLPEPIKQARRQVFRRAAHSKNKQAILQIANAYDGEGCTKAAMKLRQIAGGLPDIIPEAAPEPQAPEPEKEPSENAPKTASGE